MIVLAYCKFSIEEGTLLYMVSLLVYLGAYLVADKLYRKEEMSCGDEENEFKSEEEDVA